ncbi:Polyadenylate-binding protein 7 [Linum perenne]
MAAAPDSAATATATTTVAGASLYVGDLHPDVDDKQLFQAFGEFKSISSVRVCRDSPTGRSLCYGYVNFIVPEDAVKAMEMKNHALLNGKAMRVSWSHRDPDARRSGVGNVFVKNLSESVTNVALQELFGKYGNIVSCKIATSDDGKTKGHGFVQFDNEESANSAIEKLNGTLFYDKQIYVGKFIKRSDRALPSPDAKYTNLYVKNLELDVTEELLQEKFSKYGTVSSLVISKDDNGSSRGFGFVNFDNPDDAKRAVEAMNGIELGSKILYVGRAQKKAEREQILRRQFEEKRMEQIQKYKGSNVYVKNIDDDVTDEELRDHFSQCGTITSSKLMRDEKGTSKGFGFVCFSNPEEANKAVITYHGYMFHRKPLYVAIAQRKEDRQAQLQMQYAQRLVGLPGPSTAVIPAGYPPLYYTAPPGLVSQVPPRPGLMYPPLGIRPGWRANGFAPPTRPPFQPGQLAMMPHAQRQQRQNRGRMNGNMIPHGNASYMQPAPQPLPSPKDQNNQAKYAPNGRSSLTKSPGVSSPAPSSTGPAPLGADMLSTMLAAASPDLQKQILGERLYPLVEMYNPDQTAKITGMLLEMDNAELLLLLESPESLAAKVDEAVQVLKLSDAASSAKASSATTASQDTAAAGGGSMHSSSNFRMSAEVAVN